MQRRDRHFAAKRRWIMEGGIEGLFHGVVNTVVDRWPRSRPLGSLLHFCRIISHRGEHDNRRRFENTLPAFDAACAAGVWGIELDVRWTRDLEPVVFHDPDTRRLFGTCNAIGKLSLDRLKRDFPLIPTLKDVIARYGGRLHLMIEIKSESYPDPAVQSRRMKKTLRHLSAGEEYHLMSLSPGMFVHFGFLPSRAFIPIGRMRMDRISRLAANKGWGGVAGHFLTTSTHCVKSQHRRGKMVGTGFVDSANCLYREATRGVDWLFSNRAAHIQNICSRGQSNAQSSNNAA
jgi:glycerophosphoryl diester phosphodiesterase